MRGQDAYVAGIIANSARAEGLVSVASCTNKGEVSTTATTEFVGNLRGNSTIALGEGNIIADGLTAYTLDPKSTGINNVGLGATAKNGKFVKNGRVVIINNGNEYNLNGTKF